MANEPERPIERLLRDAARKRRDEAGAPIELHPATRRLLQGAVARTFANPGREPRFVSEVLGQLWPRFAWGVAIFAALAVAVYVLLPVPGKGGPEALLARNEPMSRAVPAKQPLPPPPAPAATVPASPAAAMKSKPAAVALAKKAPPPPATAARQLGVERQPLSKDLMAAQTDREVKEKPALAAAPRMADRKQTAETATAASSGPPAQAPAGTVNGADQRQLGFAGKPVPPTRPPAAPATPPPVTTSPAATSVVAADESVKRASDKADQPSFAYKSLAAVAPANRPQAAPVATDSLSKFAAVDRRESKGYSAAQWFAQVAPAPKAENSLANKTPPAHPVLASFQVQQMGDELRIVDGDGSVYSGYVRPAAAARRARSINGEAPAAARASRASEELLEEKAAAQLDTDRLPPQIYSFRVAGTSRSLHKKVVFTGNLLTATNLTWSLPVATNLSIGGGLGGFQNAPAQQGHLPLLNSRISGKVVIGSGKAVEVNALPTSP